MDSDHKAPLPLARFLHDQFIPLSHDQFIPFFPTINSFPFPRPTHPAQILHIILFTFSRTDTVEYIFQVPNQQNILNHP